jgi:hypothetical protein
MYSTFNGPSRQGELVGSVLMYNTKVGRGGGRCLLVLSLEGTRSIERGVLRHIVAYLVVFSRIRRLQCRPPNFLFPQAPRASVL